MANKPLPQRVEERLQELRVMGVFDDADSAYCRRTYWGDRDGWHTILINCYDRAIKAKAAA